jgi:hypothetical protein
MSRPTDTHSVNSPSALTPDQVPRVLCALRAAAGEYLELGGEELEERIMPGFSSTN